MKKKFKAHSALPSTIYHQPSTISPQPSTINHQPSLPSSILKAISARTSPISLAKLLHGFSQWFLLRTGKKWSLSLVFLLLFCFLFSPYLAQAQQANNTGIRHEISEIKQDITELKGRVKGLEERMIRVEAILEQMNERMNHFGDTLNTLMTVTITMWVTTILAIVGLFVTIILSSRRKI